MDIITRKELVKNIAERTEQTQKVVELVLSAFQDTVKEIVAKGDKVSLVGFMTAYPKEIPAKEGTIMLGENKGKKWYSKPKTELAVKLSKSYKIL